MTKPESEWTWKELPVGNVVLEPGNASQYRTGDWKTLKPVLKKELCIHCGLCYIFCPDMAYNLSEENYFIARDVASVQKNVQPEPLPWCWKRRRNRWGKGLE